MFLVMLGAAAYAAVPPRARALPQPDGSLPAPVRGVIHVHTRRSDGSGTVVQVAQAASRAGLQFVVLTDHGDAMSVPDRPSYLDGVLVIDAVEISTDSGHVVAIGLPRAPYPLAGAARDVVEDVSRMGGFAIAAHPASPKRDLQWTDWSVPVGGIEWLNADSEWRDEPPWQLPRVLLAYPARPAETLGLLLDRSDAVMRQWDELTRSRRVVALAAADAHARLGIPRAEEPSRARLALPLPGYEPVFRAFSLALPNVKLTGDPARDQEAVVNEIRAGRVFSSIDALAARPAFAFTATSGRHRAVAGETLTVDGPVRLDAHVQSPSDAQILLLRDGVQALETSGSSLQFESEPRPGVYRVEVKLPWAPGRPAVPWIVSNPIYVGMPVRPASAPPRPVSRRMPVYTNGPASDWSVEHSSSSQGAIDVVKAVGGTQLLLRYALSGSASSHPFAAFVAPTGSALSNSDRLMFRMHADRQMRVSVQLRAPGSGGAGERWHRSVFVDTTPREMSVHFDEMTPRGRTSTPKPALDQVRSLLFVVDTVNARAGTAGQLYLDDVRYER